MCVAEQTGEFYLVVNPEGMFSRDGPHLWFYRFAMHCNGDTEDWAVNRALTLSFSLSLLKGVCVCGGGGWDGERYGSPGGTSNFILLSKIRSKKLEVIFRK